MRDPWKYVAFPVAAISGYLLSLGIGSIAGRVTSFTGIPEFASKIIIIGVAGLIAGFLIDELIPAYLEKVRGPSGDLGGGGDFDSDMDFDNQ
ncbi:MAG: hypothetical protein ABEJ72_05405 [Candidatus Aenigmatarchaeota archaeon]